MSLIACRHCGTENYPHEKACWVCRQPLPANPQQQKVQKYTPSTYVPPLPQAQAKRLPASPSPKEAAQNSTRPYQKLATNQTSSFTNVALATAATILVGELAYVHSSAALFALISITIVILLVISPNQDQQAPLWGYANIKLITQLVTVAVVGFIVLVVLLVLGLILVFHGAHFSIV